MFNEVCAQRHYRSVRTLMCVIVLQIYSDDLEANCKPTNGSLSYSMCTPNKNNLYYRQFFVVVVHLLKSGLKSEL